jgi:hypothetical protein
MSYSLFISAPAMEPRSLPTVDEKRREPPRLRAAHQAGRPCRPMSAWFAILCGAGKASNLGRWPRVTSAGFPIYR